MSVLIPSLRAAIAVPQWSKNELWRRARAVPSLDLRFADNKSLVDAASGAQLVTFTRASSGTYVDSQGVIRNAVTNLLLRSEEFDDASWNKTNCIVTATNAIVAPNGSLTADTVVDAAGIAVDKYCFIAGAVSMTAGTTYTGSVYAKYAGRHLQLTFQGATHGTTYYANFDLINGIVAGSAGSGLAASIQQAGDGWYRCSISAPAVSTASSGLVIVLSNVANPPSRFVSYVGDGVSGFYLWGAQLEQSSTVGEYVPTGATINSAPRFDHNPTTGESLGLLVEESRTNLLLRSEEFQTTWIPFRATVSTNTTVAPNGQLAADTIVEDSTANSHGVLQNVSGLLNATAYAASCYFKASGRDRCRLLLFGTAFPSGTAYADFNLTAVTATPQAGVTAAITSVGGGWFRCSIAATSGAAGATDLYIQTLNASGAVSYLGNGAAALDIWGAQLEAGAFPTSYIKNVDTPLGVTRLPDIAQISGSNFSSWYRQDEGSLFAEGGPTSPTLNKTQLLVAIGDGTNTNRLYLGKKFDSTTVAEFGVVSGGTGQAFLLTTPAAMSRAALCVGYKADSFAVASRGGALSVDTSGSTPVSPNQMLIGTLDVASNNIGGHISRLTYWPQRLGNEVLQRITE